MTTTANRSTGDRGPAAPVLAPAVVARLPRRRRWGLVAVGVVMVVVCAVVAYLLVVTAGVTRPFMDLTHRVPFGATIGPSDLTVVNVSPAAGLHPIPAAERGQVIGRHAAADLFPGTLLTRDEVTDVAVPGPGQQVVGIELKPAQVPARTLKPGDAVILVLVPANSLAGVPDPQASAPASPVTINATVAGTVPPETNGNVRVDVAVSQADGPTVAAMAAAGRIALVLTGRG